MEHAAIVHHDVQALWEANKDSCWEVYDEDGEVVGTITLWDMATEEHGDFSGDELEYHCGSIEYWMDVLGEYQGRETEIPHEHAMLLQDDDVQDGNHRLVAAFLLDLKTFPAFQYNP